MTLKEKFPRVNQNTHPNQKYGFFNLLDIAGVDIRRRFCPKVDSYIVGAVDELLWQKYRNRELAIDDDELDSWFGGGTIDSSTWTTCYRTTEASYMLFTTYGPKWEVLLESVGPDHADYRTSKYEYAPLENYDRTEEYEGNESVDETSYRDISLVKSGSEKDESKSRDNSVLETKTVHGKNLILQPNTTDEFWTTDATATGTSASDTVGANESEGGSYGYGFDTSEPNTELTGGTPTSRTKNKNTQHTKTTHTNTLPSAVADDNNDTVTVTGKDGNTGWGIESENSKTFNSRQDKTDDDVDRDVSTDKEYELRAHGNIGVTTSQQMLESELKLRETSAVEEIVKDLAKLYLVEVY